MQWPDSRKTGEIEFWCRASGKFVFVNVDQNETGEYEKEGDCHASHGADIHLNVHDPDKVLNKHRQSGKRSQSGQCIKFTGGRRH